MQEIFKIDGLVAAPFAPMRNDCNLNPAVIPDYYNFLEKNGVKGVFINGTTGEGASLTQAERRLVVDGWMAAGKRSRSLKIINLVGGTSYPECIENAIYSQEAGVDAIAVIAPYFFKPSDEISLADFVTRVGESVPGLPVFFYHIPSVTGVYVSMPKFLTRISVQLPNFAGIKYTHEDLMDFLSCLNHGNRQYQMLWGRDEAMLSALVLGNSGFVGSTYNYAAPLYIKLIDAFRRNDLDTARHLQLISVNMIFLLGKYGGIGTGKAFMKYAGIDCGEFRSPVKNMTGEMYKEFVKDVKALGMDDLFSKK